MSWSGTGFFVPDYALMLSIAIVFGVALCLREAERAGYETGRIFRACLIAICSAFVSARLYVVIQDRDYYGTHVSEIFQFWKGGLASYGAYAGGVLAAVFAARWQRLTVAKFLDCCAPAIALAMVFGRLGCFLNGCCHGRISHLPWAVRFPSDSDPYLAQLGRGLIDSSQTLSLPVHPTQLYEAFYALLLFLFLTWYRKRQKFDGELFALLFALYPLGRFVNEIFRDDERGIIFGISLPQFFSLVSIVIAVSFLLAKNQRWRAAVTASGVSSSGASV
ncbi:MAG: prolipoprotein diacylglyceryl transferase [Pyrinomonadaceae bacterium]